MKGHQGSKLGTHLVALYPLLGAGAGVLTAGVGTGVPATHLHI